MIFSIQPTVMSQLTEGKAPMRSLYVAMTWTEINTDDYKSKGDSPGFCIVIDA